MASTKRVFVSDIHMSAGRSVSAGRYAYDWLDATKARAFAAFLKDLRARDDVREVVVLGDLFDLWVCPVDEVPITIREIVRAKKNAVVVREFNALAEAKPVVYLPGNHDMQVTKADLAEYFPRVIFGGAGVFDSVFRSGRLRAEHGSAHAMFNAPDPYNGGGARLPLGYYISRVAATKANRTGHEVRFTTKYLDDLLETLGPQTLPASVFEAVLEDAGLDKRTGILMGSLPTVSITAQQVMDRYAKLYEQWQTHRGPGLAFKAILAELGYLDDVADRLCKKGGTNVVIFGHSHEAEIDKDSWFVDDRVYANCGTWCGATGGTFVETEKVDGLQFVRVRKWVDGTVTTMHEEHVAAGAA